MLISGVVMEAVGVTEGAEVVEDGDRQLSMTKLVLLFLSGVIFSPPVRRVRRIWQEYV